MSFGERDDDDFSAPALDFARADNRVGRIVSALHDHVGAQRFYQLERCVFVERNDEVHRLESRQNVGAIFRVANGASRSLESLHRSVGIDSNYQRVTMRPRRSQQIHVAPMQQVEDTIGEDDFPAEILPASDRILAR